MARATALQQLHSLEEKMVKVNVAYPNKPGSHFDADYYLKVHMPMVARQLAHVAKDMTVEIGISTQDPDEPPAYAAIAGFMCESPEVFAEAFAAFCKDWQADIPNYTDIEPVFQVSTHFEFPTGSRK